MKALRLFALLLCGFWVLPIVAYAQQNGGGSQADGLPTVFSVRASAGWGIGRSRQLYGNNGTDAVYWSTGQGIKTKLALDIPIVPIEVVNDEQDLGPGKVPVVALELEAATGYFTSTGGTTVDPLPTGGIQTTSRSTGYIPVTLGLNARSSFGPGLPSVYIGAGGGVYVVALYQENVSYAQTQLTNFTRNMNPPVPFALYGALGIELPVMYSTEDGNSFMDLYAEVRLTEMSNYIYNYQQTASNGTISTVDAATDPTQLYIHELQRSASNVALTLGLKFNIY